MNHNHYKIVPEGNVAGYLDQGYELIGSPAFDPINKGWVQGVIKRAAPTQQPGHLGGVRPTVDLSDVSLDLVDPRVFDTDGVELKVSDWVVFIEDKDSPIKAEIFSIDPIFSTIDTQLGRRLSTSVRFNRRP